MPTRTRTDLLAVAGQYAQARQAPQNVVVKELLHYEILYALVQSGAAEHLTFQGGTCLRLCYGGSRYSEDLDFAGGRDFHPAQLERFGEILQREIAYAYGLRVDIRAKSGSLEGDGVRVDRWQSRIEIPQADPSIPQKQVINLEVATVPAHRPELVAVAANYPHLSGPFRQLLVPAESRDEILADKVVALGARKFLKFRDIWDLKMLTDTGLVPDADLVRLKLEDYGLELRHFRQALIDRASALRTDEHLAGFHAEMSRFVDAGQASMLKRPALARAILVRSAVIAERAVEQLAPRASGPAM